MQCVNPISLEKKWGETTYLYNLTMPYLLDKRRSDEEDMWPCIRTQMLCWGKQIVGMSSVYMNTNNDQLLCFTRYYGNILDIELLSSPCAILWRLDNYWVQVLYKHGNQIHIISKVQLCTSWMLGNCEVQVLKKHGNWRVVIIGYNIRVPILHNRHKIERLICQKHGHW